MSSDEADAFDEMTAPDHSYLLPAGHYTSPRPLFWVRANDGSREGMQVGLISCRRCGACLTLDNADDVNVVETHEDFHERVDPWPPTK